jgi:hypothetical protein
MWLDDPHCRYCRAPIRFHRDAVLDHAVPASRGGGDGMANAVLSCKSCDRAKGDRTIEEWKDCLLRGLFRVAFSTESGKEVVCPNQTCQ